MNNTFEFINLSPEDFKKKAKIRMGWRILVFFGIVFLSLAIAMRNDVGSLCSYVAALVFAVVGMIVLYIKKNPDPLFTFGALFGSVIAQTSCWFVMEASHYVDFVWITICTVLAFLGAQRKYAVILLFLNTLGVGYFILFRRNAHIVTLRDFNTMELAGAYIELILSLFILGYLLYQFMGFQKVWELAYQETNKALQNQNETIKKQNQENIILLKEIHHRVKNNLQIIISLLRLQKNELKTEESRVQFQEAINRVMVMSTIHQKLYQQERLNQVNLEQYLNELIAELSSLFKSAKTIKVNVKCNYKEIDLKTTVPVGLLANELLSNSFKYAFTDKKEGVIDIHIHKSDTGFNLIYRDNGTWKPNAEKKGFGLELIDILTEQLNGQKKLKTNPEGTEYIFKLNLAE